MIENLKRIREPITWAVIAVVAANIVLGLVELGFRWSTGGLVPADFSDIGTSLMNVSLVLTVVVLVCTCFFITPATAHALLVTKVAAWVLTVGSLLTLVCWILGIAASANTLAIVLEFVGGFLDLVIKSLAAGSLWVLLRGVNAGRIDTRSAAVAEVPAAPPAKAPDPPTTWQ
ncbi:MAG: hypothetical protein WAL91_08280, partial [Propionicimonas sp.]